MNTTASQIAPTCFLFNHRGHGPLAFTGCTVISETKSTITVKPVGRSDDWTSTFQKVRNPDGTYQDPKVTTATSRHSMLESIVERGGDRSHPNHLTFDLAGVNERRLNQKIERRKAGLRDAQKVLETLQADLARTGNYQPSDEVYEQLQKLKAAIASDLA